MFFKIGVPKNFKFQISETPVLVSLLIKLKALKGIFKDTFFHRAPPVTASVAFLKIRKIHRKTPVTKSCNFIKKETLTQVFSYEFCKIFKITYFKERPLSKRVFKKIS